MDAQLDQPLVPLEQPQEKQCDYFKWMKIGLALSVLITLIILVSTNFQQITIILQDFLQWVQQSGFLGMLACTIFYILGATLLIPGLVLNLIIGYIYTKQFGIIVGMITAFFVVLFGATIGSIVAMLIGRYLFREVVYQRAKNYPKFLAIQQAIREEGFKIVALLRLCPLLPFSIFNYIVGVTSITLLDYAKASVGMIPGLIVYVYLGSALNSITQAIEGKVHGNVVQLVLIIVSCVLSIAVAIYVSIVAKRKINNLMNQVGDS